MHQRRARVAANLFENGLGTVFVGLLCLGLGGHARPTVKNVGVP